jgi:sulfur-oxidizing protein SoxY
MRWTTATGAAKLAISTDLLTPRRVVAAWPKAAFDAATVDAAVEVLYGSSTLRGSDQIQIKTPDIAENGSVVPITVSTDISGAHVVVFS